MKITFKQIFNVVIFVTIICIGLYAHHHSKSDSYKEYQKKIILLRDLGGLRNEVLCKQDNVDSLSRISSYGGSAKLLVDEIRACRGGNVKDYGILIAKIDATRDSIIAGFTFKDMSVGAVLCIIEVGFTLFLLALALLVLSVLGIFLFPHESIDVERV